MNQAQQKSVCDQYSAEYCPPIAGSRAGVAVKTLGSHPLNGMRVCPSGETCGWYLWAGGEPSDADDFYEPMCIEHISDYCPAALPFLALPPGWRFLTDGEYSDVWYDATILNTTKGN